MYPIPCSEPLGEVERLWVAGGEAQVLTSGSQRTFPHWHLQGKQQGLATGVAESKLKDRVQLDPL